MMQHIYDEVTAENVRAIISANDDVYTILTKGSRVYRLQETKYDEPRYYNDKSDNRYSDAKNEIATLYVAGSACAAVVECLQHGGSDEPDESDESGCSSITTDFIEESSLFELEACRDLRLVDVGTLATLCGFSLSDIVRKKGSKAEGYLIPQLLSGAVMRAGLEIDGIIYLSRAYPKAGSEGVCIALFDRKNEQLRCVSRCLLSEYALPNRKTVPEFLFGRGVSFE